VLLGSPIVIGVVYRITNQYGEGEKSVEDRNKKGVSVLRIAGWVESIGFRVVILTKSLKYVQPAVFILLPSSLSSIFSSSRSPQHLPTSYLAQDPMSNFFAGPEGEMSKSKMSMGKPIVVQAFGICYVSAKVMCKTEPIYIHQQYQQRDLAQAHTTAADRSGSHHIQSA